MGRTVQKTNLLGDDDDGDMAMGGSTALSRARARRNGTTPQHEYPIFTPVSFVAPPPPVQICSVIRVPRLPARDTNSSRTVEEGNSSFSFEFKRMCNANPYSRYY